MSHSKILILDFGSQVTQLIARRVREAHVFCEVHPCDVSSDWVREFAADGQLKGIILSGSHASVYEVDDKAPEAVFELGVPVLGICYGMQTMANQLGGKVEAGATREFGYAEVRAHGHTELFKGIEDFSTTEGHGMLKVWMSHGDKVTALPPGFKLMARCRAGRSSSALCWASAAHGPTGSWAITSKKPWPRSASRLAMKK
jgi:GMP synthase (glutamine-hydrolysing)